MRFVSRVGLVTAGLLAVTLAPVSAATGRLTITSGGSEYVDLVLRRPTQIDLARWTAVGGGSFFGFYVTSAAAPGGGLGSVEVRRFRRPGFDPARIVLGVDYLAAPDKPVRTLAAGRYRIFVLSDRPVRISLPTPGAASRTVATRRRATVSVSQHSFEQVRSGQPAAMHAELPINVGRRSVGVVALRVVAARAFFTDAAVVDLCFGPRGLGSSCQIDGDRGAEYEWSETHSGAFGTGATVGSLDQTFYKPGTTVPGPRAARISAAGTPLVQYAHGFALALTL